MQPTDDQIRAACAQLLGAAQVDTQPPHGGAGSDPAEARAESLQQLLERAAADMAVNPEAMSTSFEAVRAAVAGLAPSDAALVLGFVVSYVLRGQAVASLVGFCRCGDPNCTVAAAPGKIVAAVEMAIGHKMAAAYEAGERINPLQAHLTLVHACHTAIAYAKARQS